jgi:uncharacterized protein YllA (UPF0747 family)
MSRLKLKPEDLFKGQEELVKEHILALEPMKKLNLIQQEIELSQQKIIALGSLISSPTEKSMRAHIAKLNRINERIAQKLQAGIKKEEEATIAKIRHIQNEVLPNETLQERSFNFLTIYKWAGFEMFDILLKSQEAFGDTFLIVQAPVRS